MTIMPPVLNTPYNQVKNGFYGQLGEGANANVRFLQTVISHDELSRITLIENIPGSESWDVRDLFQRDVDDARVTQDILPYFKDDTKVKYFNPLTLILLPFENDGATVLTELVAVDAVEMEILEHRYDVYEMEGLFRFKVHQQNPAFSEVSWNDSRVKVVAIDGQHRLSALMRWRDAPGGMQALRQWKIPVVILGIFKADENKSAATVLEVVRKTFVYINSYAEKINEAREILLNDESVNRVCVQEIVQDAHTNDCKDLGERDLLKIPLIFFDWRGETINRQRVPGPAAVKTIEEVFAWFEHYILGSDGDTQQEGALDIVDMMPPLETFGVGKKLSHEETLRIREQFKETVFHGFNHLLTEFAPYKRYIAACREIEKQAIDDSDLAEHAFTKIRFGRCTADPHIRDNVEEKFLELVHKFEGLKNEYFPELLSLDIGMRGIVAAFSKAKPFYDDNIANVTSPWLDYAQWFTKCINSVYEDDWFESYDNLAPEKQKLLTHVAFDPAGAIVNYKFTDASKAFGSFLTILVFRKGSPTHVQELVWEEFSDNLKGPVRTGFRKQHRAELRDIFTGTNAQFISEINKRAGESVETRLSELKEHVGLT